MSVYIQVVNGVVVSAFPSVQDPEEWPGITAVEDEDPLYVNFLSSLEPSPAALAAAKKDNLLMHAALRIAPLQDALDVGEITPEEQAYLLAWKKYRVALNRVNDQPRYPDTISWPDTPNQ